MGSGRWKDFDVCISSPTISDCLIHCLRPVILYLSVEICSASFRFNGMQSFSTVRIIHFPDAIDTPYSLVGDYYVHRTNDLDDTYTIITYLGRRVSEILKICGSRLAHSPPFLLAFDVPKSRLKTLETVLVCSVLSQGLLGPTRVFDPLAGHP